MHWSSRVSHFPPIDYALNPLCRELQGVAGTLVHACAEASAICSFCIPALQMFAKDLMCFIPYWDRDPQYFSKVLTCIKIRLRKIILIVIGQRENRMMYQEMNAKVSVQQIFMEEMMIQVVNNLVSLKQNLKFGTLWMQLILLRDSSTITRCTTLIESGLIGTESQRLGGPSKKK